MLKLENDFKKVLVCAQEHGKLDAGKSVEQFRQEDAHEGITLEN